MNEEAPIVNHSTSLKDALMTITEKKLGLALITKNKKVIGVFTDGDLRRSLNNEVDINETAIKDVMTSNFLSIQSNALAIEAAEMMEKNKIFSLVVNSPNDTESNLGVITMHQLLESGVI